jgi:N-formylglutamate deformylase
MLFDLINPTSKIPMILSVPHAGTRIPEELRPQYIQEKIAFIDDTDWYVDQLYHFAVDMGITMIKANYSRWVIDLNRNAYDKPLYNDGRVITALTPVSDFNGNPIYKKKGPDSHEIQRRISTYYNPYYQKIEEILADRLAKHNHVLFFDAHSIRQLVPGIRMEKFPDLILGDADETSADARLIASANAILQHSGYSYQHNDPFKGGNLTRTFGQPARGIHALQLEMSKTLYMDNNETQYDEVKAGQVQKHLSTLFEKLLDTLDELNNK